MLRSKKITSTPAPFRMPTLAEADPEYAALIERRGSLHQASARLQADLRELQAQLAKEPAPAFKPEVAELLGESAGSASSLRASIKDKEAQVTNHRAGFVTLTSFTCDERNRARASPSSYQ